MTKISTSTVNFLTPKPGELANLREMTSTELGEIYTRAIVQERYCIEMGNAAKDIRDAADQIIMGRK